jgi:hypothetical protein
MGLQFAEQKVKRGEYDIDKGLPRFIGNLECATLLEVETILAMGIIFRQRKATYMVAWVEAVLRILAKQGSLHGFEQSTSMLEIGAGSWLSGDHLHGKDLKRYQNGIPKAQESTGKDIIRTLRSRIWSNNANIPVGLKGCGGCKGAELQSQQPSMLEKSDLKTSLERGKRKKGSTLAQAQFVGYYQGWGSSAALGIPCGVIQISDYKMKGMIRTPVSDIPWFYEKLVETTLPCRKHNQESIAEDFEKDHMSPRLPLRFWVPTPENFANDRKLRKLSSDQLVIAFETYDVLHRLDGMSPKIAQEICTRI